MPKAPSSIKAARGFSLLEITFTVVIISLVGVAVVSQLLSGERASFVSSDRSRAIFLAEQGMDIVRNIANQSFSNFKNHLHYLSKGPQSKVWILVPDPVENLIDGKYIRKVDIEDLDTNRKKVTVTISWEDQQVALVTVFTRTKLNQKRDWAQSGVSGTKDFNMSNVGQNEVLAAEALQNHLYIANSSPDISGNKDLVIIDVTDDTLPIVGSLVLSGGGAKDLDVSSDGTRTLLATTNNSNEMQLIDTSNKVGTLPAPVASLNLILGNDSADPNGVALSNNDTLAFVTRPAGGINPNFIILNVSPSSLSLTGGSLTLSPAPVDVKAHPDNKKWVFAIGGSSFYTMDVQNPDSPQLVNTYNMVGVGGAAYHLSIYPDGSRAIIAFDSGNPDLLVLDITNPIAPFQVTTLNLASDYGVNWTAKSVESDLIFALTGDNSLNFKVVNTATWDIIETLTLSDKPNTGAYNPAEDPESVYAISSGSSAGPEVKRIRGG